MRSLAVLVLVLTGATAGACAGHICSGFAWYPSHDPRTTYSSEFDVPGLPENTSVFETATYYIYTNLFFPNYAVDGRGVYNQFVPQLMLGDALSGSSGPPLYEPTWSTYPAYVFSAQYFFDILDSRNVSPQPKAVTGEVFSCEPGERLWTRFTLSDDGEAWTLSMGVVGDAARTSTVLASAPYMGLLAPATTSWREAGYALGHLNSCWELYGTDDRADFPSTGATFEMRIDTVAPIAWATNWSNYVNNSPCPGAPNSTNAEVHNATQQVVSWRLFW